MRTSVMDEHFGRAVATVVVARHHEAVRTSVGECQHIAHTHFVQRAIPSKRIRLADVANNRVDARRTCWIGDVRDVMIGVVEHRTNQMIQP